MSRPSCDASISPRFGVVHGGRCIILWVVTDVQIVIKPSYDSDVMRNEIRSRLGFQVFRALEEVCCIDVEC